MTGERWTGKCQPSSSSSASVLSSLERRAQLHSPWPLQPPFLCCCCPDFYFPLCLRILRVPASGTAALGNLPKGFLLAFALPSSCFLGLGAHPKQCLCHPGQAAVQAPGQAPTASCSPVRVISPGWCKNPSEAGAAPKAVENWSLVCVDKSQSTPGLCQGIPLQIKP